MSGSRATDLHPEGAWQIARDAHQYNNLFFDWELDFEQLQRRPIFGKARCADVDGVQIFEGWINAAVRYRGCWRSDSRLIAIYNSQNPVTLNGRIISNGAIVQCPSSAMSAFFASGSYHTIGMVVPEQLIRQHLGDMSPEVTVCHADRRGSGPVAQEPLMRILSLLGDDRDQEARRSKSSGILSKALNDLSAATTDQWCRLPPSSTRSFIVAKACDYLDSNLHRMIQLTELSDAVGVSDRTLRYSFHDIAGVSPSDYLLMVRLNRVHRDLCSPNSRSGVHETASRYGFEHLGRFAQAYRAVFGRRPSETLYHQQFN